MKGKKLLRLHFVGIGGIGMSGIAKVFLNQGYCVTGSDLCESETTQQLTQLGAKITFAHQPENVLGAHVVVVSSAIRSSNLEVLEAKRLRIPLIPRAEMLGELMRGKLGIAVAGTHGKTTCTSMLAMILTEAGLDPTVVVGGKVDSLGGNAKLGKGHYVVAEADESDGSFLHLPASYAVVTNIDNDHLDHFGNVTAIEDAFVEFIGTLPFYGVAAVCAEDPGVQRCLSRWTKPIVTYGFSPEWDFYATQLDCLSFGTAFDVFSRTSLNNSHQFLCKIEIQIPGKYNVLNAMAALVIAAQLDVSVQVIQKALLGFRGVRRRFEIRWQDRVQKKAIIDDYGHHPTEIVATLSAAKSFWPGRIITVFQPHRYTRTLHCKEAFTTAFQNTDVLLITDLYPAGEEPIEGIDSKFLVKEIGRTFLPHQEIVYVGSLDQARTAVLSRFSEGDLVLCLGAGSITHLSEQLTEAVIL